MEASFLIFAFYCNHIVAYQVESTDLQTFHLRILHSNQSIKTIFPDKLTLNKNDGIWQQNNDLEKELCHLIDEWMIKNMYVDREPLVLTHSPAVRKKKRTQKH